LHAAVADLVMAIQPHCVACWDVDVAGSVEFDGHRPGWRWQTAADGVPIVGWSNELGVTAPPGVGLFCKCHLRRATPSSLPYYEHARSGGGCGYNSDVEAEVSDVTHGVTPPGAAGSRHQL
jgi:hypothetical protein